MFESFLYSVLELFIMQGLEAKVKQPLVIGSGVEQYMSVNSSQGDMLIIPQPNNLGLYAQSTSRPGDTVKVAPVSKGYGILLNDNGSQYGAPMDYSNLGRQQVIYVFNQEKFPRGKVQINSKYPKKNSVQMYVFGKSINVRYGSEDAANFQGFVVCAEGFYRMWFPLGKQTVKDASEDRNYRNINSMLKGFSFATGQLPAKYGTVKLGNHAYQVPVGSYSILGLFQGLSDPSMYSNNLSKVALVYGAHLYENNPINVDGKLISKTGSINILPGTVYMISMHVEPKPVPKPVPKPEPIRPGANPASSRSCSAPSRENRVPSKKPTPGHSLDYHRRAASGS